MKQELETQKKQNTEEATFEIGDMQKVALVLVVTGILISFGLSILADVGEDFTANSAEANATADTVTGVAKLSAKLPLIATVVVAVIIIGILLRYFRS